MSTWAHVNASLRCDMMSFDQNIQSLDKIIRNKIENIFGSQENNYKKDGYILLDKNQYTKSINNKNGKIRLSQGSEGILHVRCLPMFKVDEKLIINEDDLTEDNLYLWSCINVFSLHIFGDLRNCNNNEDLIGLFEDIVRELYKEKIYLRSCVIEIEIESISKIILSLPQGHIDMLIKDETVKFNKIILK